MLIWFIVTIVCIGVELMTLGLVSIWFAIGAIVAMFFTNLTLEHQFYIFVIVSLVTLISFRKISMKYVKGKSKESDRIRGASFKIDSIKDGIYEGKLDGKHWIGICEKELIVGEIAKVKDIKGIKLILEKNKF